MTTSADIKEEVRTRYGKIAASGVPSTGGNCGCCCGGDTTAEAMSKAIGYSDEEISAAPEGANLGLGCGNPTALAALEPGETVVDLGSGGGFDAFLAAKAVGETGRVIGIDMTPEMIARAKENASKGGFTNVEFRLGEIEDLPLKDGHVDSIISNCVINLSTDKPQVFREALRVLKPGGRLMVSDLVLLHELPEPICNSMAAYAGCIAGAMLKDDYLNAMKEAGFINIEVKDETGYPIENLMNDPSLRAIAPDMDDFDPEDIRKSIAAVVSIKVVAYKGEDCGCSCC